MALSIAGLYRVSTAGRTGAGTVHRGDDRRPAADARPVRDHHDGLVEDPHRHDRPPRPGSNRTGKGRLAPGDFGLIDGTLGAFEPSTLVSLFGGTAWLRVGPEVKNGVPATHYRRGRHDGHGSRRRHVPARGEASTCGSLADGRLVAFEAERLPERESRRLGDLRDRGHAHRTTRRTG